ncbi:tRNA 2-thiouridine(34) synthase MnmA [Desulfothermus okinawensis JCM 13304]
MKVAVAVSGGVDSLFSALLLKEKGYEVVGVFGVFTEELNSIKEVVRDKFLSLGIDCIFFDLISEFKTHVIDSFVKTYVRGLTPNPCSICNRHIKFGVLRKKVFNMGFDAFATGHYAQVRFENNEVNLLRGTDRAKDQSYFLSLVESEDFQRVKMPLGAYKKDDVWEELKKRGIEPALTYESQEICFIKDNYRDFLKKMGKKLPDPGKIIGVFGEELGTHKGLFSYTIGQRRGLGIPYKEPLYVVDKDIKNNLLIVGTKDDLLRDWCWVHDVNSLISMDNWPRDVEVQVNYNMKPKKARWKINCSKIKVIFEEKIPRPTPGQICCFYSGDLVLGGGIIGDGE